MFCNQTARRAGNTIAHLANVAAAAAIVATGTLHVGATPAVAESLEPMIPDSERHCLQKNIFFESRNQSTLGQVAVAWVTVNRTDSPLYPNTLCRVVKQAQLDSNRNPIKHKCQFSWYCDGKSDQVPDNAVATRAWEDAGIVADVVLLDWLRARKGPVGEAVMYHATYVEPYWADSYTQVAQVDDHIFYE
jgi:spore germination cell wall hydrolase CwlJ-like protein